MNAAPWKIVAAMLVGSMAGALLRQTSLLLIEPGTSWRPAAFVVSAAGGLILGALLGWAASAPSVRPAWRPPAMVTIVAMLGAFSAVAVINPSEPAAAQPERLLLLAALHIVIGILAATLGLGMVRRRIGR